MKILNAFKKSCDDILSHINDTKEHIENKIENKLKEPDLNSKWAWTVATYGISSWKPIDQRIKSKQKYIKTLIRSKALQVAETDIYISPYHCTVDLELDLIDYADEIFKPFKDKGFKVVEAGQLLGESGVYMISWRYISFSENN